MYLRLASAHQQPLDAECCDNCRGIGAFLPATLAPVSVEPSPEVQLYHALMDLTSGETARASLLLHPQCAQRMSA